jgi:hypothetical protein
VMVWCWWCKWPTSWEPQEKVWWAQQQVFSQLWNQGNQSNRRKPNLRR